MSARLFFRAPVRLLVTAMAICLPLFAAWPSAAASSGMAIRIVNYGVYSETAPGGFLEFKDKTQTVPGRMGTLFGAQFEVIGVDGKTPLDIQIRLSHPAFRDPSGGPSTTQDNWNVRVKPGEPSFAGFVFDAKWKIVPGVWTFEFLYKSVKLADYSFQVVAVKDAGQAQSGPLGRAAASLNSSQVAQAVKTGQSGQQGQKPEDIPTVPPVPEDADEAPKPFKEVTKEEARREEAKAMEKTKRQPVPDAAAPAAAQPAAAPQAPAQPERWIVQAVFQSRENADAFAKKLREAGFASAGVYPVQEGGRSMHAAHAGLYASEAAAKQAADGFEQRLGFRPVTRKLDPALLAQFPASAASTPPTVAAAVSAPPVKASAVETIPAPQAAEPTSVGDRLYMVKVGSFTQEENAQGLVRELNSRGWKAQIQKRPDAKGNVLHIVTLGAFKDVKDALKVSGDYQAREKKDAMVLTVKPDAGEGAPAQPSPAPAAPAPQAQTAQAAAPAAQSHPGPDTATKTVYYVLLSEHPTEVAASDALSDMREKGYGPCLLREKEAKRFSVIFGPYGDKTQAEREAQNFGEMEMRRVTVRFLDRDAFNAKASCK